MIEPCDECVVAGKRCPACKKLAHSIRNKNYRKTPKGKAASARSAASESHQRAMKKYRGSKKGKATAKAYVRTKEFKDRQRAIRQRPESRERHRVYSILERRRYPERTAARSAANGAVRSGKLPRPDSLLCRCGSQAKHYHHHLGYSKEYRLDVIPVCVNCHEQEHHQEQPCGV